MHRVLQAVCLLALFALAPGARAEGHAAVGEIAPPFRLAATGGTVVSDSLRGRVVYVDFWASWCEPCRRSFPWLRDLHERYASKGLAIVAINLDRERAAADKFLVKYPAPFLVAFDPEGKSAETFEVAAMPTSVLIGRDGRVLERHSGFDPKRAEQIEERIKKECAR